ncbi:unnamed protein product [Linum tenue]|uniref:Uncharacterized protein n=1 Tax=Linum tenue TaxID=586396 RepID=A0AAV0J9T9_9ROSI|nr:unnamed protein product [Linum tenue]
MQGKVAVITGGATGLGASAARLFARHGAKVVIADIQPEPASQIQSESGQPVTYVQCDVTSDSDMQNAVDAAVSMHGKLDIMYSNAAVSGAVRQNPLSVVDREAFRNAFDVNVYGSFLAAKHAARVMIPEGKGSILMSGSMVTASYGAAPHLYVATKHAVVGLAKNLCVELGGYGIRVNSISPYGVATPMGVESSGLDEETYEGLFTAMANLKGVVFKAEDVAEAALTLVSDESRYISGVNLLVDGGHSLKSA